MIWSKTKKALEGLLADSVKAHVQFHITSYGPGHSSTMNRGWITWDKQELVSFSNIVHWQAAERFAEALRAEHEGEPGNEYRSYHATAEVIVSEAQRVFSRDAFEDAVDRYLTLSIDDALIDPSPIVRALAMLDRRLGKRRLKELVMDDQTHPLVKLLYTRRCDAEGLLLTA